MKVRLRPPVTESICGGCGVTIRERNRRPCPFCSSTERVVARRVTESLTAHDRAR